MLCALCLVVLIGLQFRVEPADRLEILVRQQHPERRAVRTERDGEDADRIDPGPVQRRHRHVAQIVAEVLAHRRAQVVLAKLVVFRHRLVGRLRLAP